MNDVNLAIENLKKSSEAIDKVSQSDKVYNTEYGLALQNMSWEMYRMAQELEAYHKEWGM